MTRASAANAETCPDEPVRRRAVGGAGRGATARGWIPPSASLGVVVMVLALIVVTLQHLRTERDLALREAAHEVDLRATIVATRLNAALAAAPQASPAEIFRLVLGAHPEERLARAELVDREGRRIAVDPPEATTRPSPAEDALSARNDGSSVIRVSDDEAGDRFAAIRALPATAGRVAFVSPVELHLAVWRRAAMVTVVLLGATVALVVVGAGLYAADARGRRKRLREERARRARVDVALNHGRCGLWTWDLQRGRIAWSASMFGVLDLAERPGHWMIADLQSLMHPEDESLEGIARLAAESRGDCIDIEFRMRAADGRWVWLRKRAELVEDGETGGASLIGIAFDVTDRKREAEASATADQRLRDAIEVISEAFVLWDSSNRLVLCNSKYQRLHNLSNEAVRSGALYADLATLGALRDSPANSGGPVAASQHARTYEARLLDGRWLQVNERRTRDGGFVSVGTDITALKEHEEQLMNSERLLLATVAQLRQSRRSLEEQAQQLA